MAVESGPVLLRNFFGDPSSRGFRAAAATLLLGDGAQGDKFLGQQGVDHDAGASVVESAG